MVLATRFVVHVSFWETGLWQYQDWRSVASTGYSYQHCPRKHLQQLPSAMAPSSGSTAEDCHLHPKFLRSRKLGRTMADYATSFLPSPPQISAAVGPTAAMLSGPLQWSQVNLFSSSPGPENTILARQAVSGPPLREQRLGSDTAIP